ncbi:hypothetical protein E2C01_019064 [Portunus trituberculatus]|uniref:Uncharacterized protein n=1 Tax=Portunus trituberculatus TaxID=210409 RepID=A0A5B7DWP0_PORTR|nr:hypothetical protein [Portunus trituberculatus]
MVWNAPRGVLAAEVLSDGLQFPTTPKCSKANHSEGGMRTSNSVTGKHTAPCNAQLRPGGTNKNCANCTP